MLSCWSHLVVFLNALPLVPLPAQLLALRVQSSRLVSCLALQLCKLQGPLMKADAHLLLLSLDLSQTCIAAMQLILQLALSPLDTLHMQGPPVNWETVNVKFCSCESSLYADRHVASA